MYPLRNGGRDAVCGVALTPSHSDLYHTWLINQNLPQGFTTDPPQVAQLRDPIVALESCALCAHRSVLNRSLAVLIPFFS